MYMCMYMEHVPPCTYIHRKRKTHTDLAVATRKSRRNPKAKRKKRIEKKKIKPKAWKNNGKVQQH